MTVYNQGSITNQAFSSSDGDLTGLTYTASDSHGNLVDQSCLDTVTWSLTQASGGTWDSTKLPTFDSNSTPTKVKFSALNNSQPAGTYTW